MKNKFLSRAALLVVDVQNDFCPGGALGVKHGDRIIPRINEYIKLFRNRREPVILSRDWHPEETSHFLKYGGIWPRHCVRRTKGARFHSGLRFPRKTIIVSKGMEADADSYSAFNARDKEGHTLGGLLRTLRVKRLFICGLATDYCVKYSVLDSRSDKFETFVLSDAVKGVDLNKGDSAAALEEMQKKGAVLIKFKGIKDILGKKP